MFGLKKQKGKVNIDVYVNICYNLFIITYNITINVEIENRKDLIQTIEDVFIGTDKENEKIGKELSNLFKKNSQDLILYKGSSCFKNSLIVECLVSFDKEKFEIIYDKIKSYYQQDKTNDINRQDEMFNNTFLMLLIKKGYYDLAVQVIDDFSDKIDVNLAKNDGNTALHFASFTLYMCKFGSIEKSSEKLLEKLMQKGADFYRKNNLGYTPIQLLDVTTNTLEVLKNKNHLFPNKGSFTSIFNNKILSKKQKDFDNFVNNLFQKDDPIKELKIKSIFEFLEKKDYKDIKFIDERITDEKKIYYINEGAYTGTLCDIMIDLSYHQKNLDSVMDFKDRRLHNKNFKHKEKYRAFIEKIKEAAKLKKEETLQNSLKMKKNIKFCDLVNNGKENGENCKSPDMQ